VESRRFIVFIVLSAVILMGYMALENFVLAPLRPPPNRPKAVADKIPGEKKNGAEKKDPVQPPDGGGPERPAAIGAGRAALAEEWLTLGSLDAARNATLVTLTSRGAAVSRIELADPRYREIADRPQQNVGYLGYLMPTDAPQAGGVVVNVVGAGTPAALAPAVPPQPQPGMQPGDVIVSADGQPITKADDFSRFLAGTRPGQTVALIVRRTSPAGPLVLSFTVPLIKRPLSVVSPEHYVDKQLNVLSADEHHPVSFLLSLPEIGDRKAESGDIEIAGLPSLRHRTWQITRRPTPGDAVAEFTLDMAPEDLQAAGLTGGLQIVKRYRLGPRGAQDNATTEPRADYDLTFEIEIRNLGDEPQPVVYALDGPTGLPLEGWWYAYKVHPSDWSATGTRDVVWRSVGGGHKMFRCPKIVDDARNKRASPFFDPTQEQPRMRYAGVDAVYFFAALVSPATDDPDDPFDNAATYSFARAGAHVVAEIDPVADKRTNLTFRLVSRTVTIPAGDAFRQRFTIFAGPKDRDVLAAYELEDVIVYGWFAFFARVLATVLHTCYFLVGNYGLAIVLLTVFVRACMFPLSRKQAISMQKMQELAPELKKISEKYANDVEKQRQAQMELYRKHNYNPFGGCLLMFFQLPVFIGLYRALSVDIGLRDASLIPGIPWASNLAGPDMLWYWEPILWESVGGFSGYLGPYLNLLPLATIVLFIVHQRMFTPPATDEQQQMQQKMMMFMMIFMGFLFFKVPSGLCLYFIASSLWGLAERLLIPKPGTANASEKKPAAAPASGGPNGATRKEREKERRKQRKK
jgi:YidC/Oxa1 family membrane protein insertase